MISLLVKLNPMQTEAFLESLQRSFPEKVKFEIKNVGENEILICVNYPEELRQDIDAMLRSIEADARYREWELPEDVRKKLEETEKEMKYLGFRQEDIEGMTVAARRKAIRLAKEEFHYDKISTLLLEGSAEVIKIGSFAVPGLLECLKLTDEDLDDSQVVGEAIKSLIKIGQRAVPGLIQALKDKQSLVRLRAAGILGKIGDKAISGVPALIQALKDEDRDVERNAASALGEIGDKSAVPALVRVLQDKDSHLRYVAASSLGQIGDKSAVLALMKGLKDKDSHVRDAIVSALSKIVPEACYPGDSTLLSREIQRRLEETAGEMRSLGFFQNTIEGMSLAEREKAILSALKGEWGKNRRR